MDDITDINELNKQIEQLRKNRGQDVRHLDEYEEPTKQKADNFGVFSFQLMLVLIIAIAYVLLLTFAKPASTNILLLIKEKESVDFSFRDKVYDSVGAFLTYINQQADTIPPVLDSDSSQKQTASSKDTAETLSSSGVGGDFTPVVNEEVPANCTLMPISLTGKVTFPLKGSYFISSPFGFRNHPITGKSEFHTAVDFACGKGETVYAIASGTVIKSEKDPSLGNYILLDHGDSFFTIYGHCDSLKVHKGDTVKEGDVIAKVGSTGDSTGNHLHFGAKKDEQYFDPEYLF